MHNTHWEQRVGTGAAVDVSRPSIDALIRICQDLNGS